MIPPAKIPIYITALVLIGSGWHVALSAPQCLLPEEKTAFDVRVLQTKLMIVALSCGQHEEYNFFVTRHQQTLTEADQLIGSHFRRLYGSAGEQQHDEYITTLANALSQDGIRQGPYFCRDVKRVVLQSLTLQDKEEMSRFVTETNMTNPYMAELCEVVPDRNVVPNTSVQRKLIDIIHRQSDAAHRRPS